MELQEILNNNPQLRFCYENKDPVGFERLFADHLDANQQLKSIYNNRNLRVYESIFTRFDYCISREDTSHWYPQNNLLYGIQFFGFNLSRMNLENYIKSDFLPILRTTCRNLSKLKVKFCECHKEHFEGIFEFMPQLVELKVLWQWKNHSLPSSFIESLAGVSQSLQKLHLFSLKKMKKPICLSEKFNDVFKTFNLKNLRIDYFNINDELIQLIQKMEIDKLHINVGSNTNLKRLCTLKNMQKLSVYYNIDDTLIEEVAKNSSALKKITVGGLLITNEGVKALTTLSELEHIALHLTEGYKNAFLTKSSVESLTKMTQLRVLRVNNCIKINNGMVYDLICKLKKLHTLSVLGTGINFNLTSMLLGEKVETRRKILKMFVSYKTQENASNILERKKNIKISEG